MRAYRHSVVFSVSALVLTAAIVGSAEARPFIPGILGSMMGTVRGLVGHHHRGSRAARHSAAPHVATRAPTEQQVAPATATASATAVAGVVFWPQLGDDLFDYVFWPSGNDDRFWAIGYRDVVDGALRPPGRSAAPARGGRAQTTASAGNAPASCASQQGAETADSVIARIETTVQPTEAQRPALDELRGAVARAFEYIDAACPNAGPPTPTARLDAMEDRIWAARQALLVTRAAINRFYRTLTDEQKARLNGPAAASVARGAGCNETAPDLAAMFGGRGRPPTAEQRAGLQALRTTSASLAKLLAACPSSLPATPIERLDVADARLNSLLYSVVTLRAPLDSFSTASQEQQQRLSRSQR